MSTEVVLSGIVGLIAGLVGKIIFDWVRYGRNNPKGNPNGTLHDMLAELRTIKDTVLWSKQIQDSMDPNTGQPRWYNTGLTQEVRSVKYLLKDSLKLERRNREMLLRIWARMTGSTDPGVSAEDD